MTPSGTTVVVVPVAVTFLMQFAPDKVNPTAHVAVPFATDTVAVVLPATTEEIVGAAGTNRVHCAYMVVFAYKAVVAPSVYETPLPFAAVFHPVNM